MLRPVMVVDCTSGDLLTEEEWNKPVQALLNHIQASVERTWGKYSARLVEEVENFTGSANSYGRSLGYKLDYTKLPHRTLAKSRINELYLHNLVSGVSSYVLNPQSNKQTPSFPKQVNLGAVDKQMVTVSVNNNELSLKWKCWNKELLFVFTLPAYIQAYDVHKYCLPIVRLDKDGNIRFNFSIKENIPERLTKNTQRAGLDWGVRELYTIAVVNQNGRIAAHYTPSRQLRKLQKKKDALTLNRQRIFAKLERLTQYGDHVKLPNLTRQHHELTHKITRMGITISKLVSNEITQKIVKHDLRVLNLEQLNWVTGTSSNKAGSNHSFQHARMSNATTHSLARFGLETQKVNAAGTSQECHTCGTQVTHNHKTRTVRCDSCQSTLDRDFNAAINIALRSRTLTPLSNRLQRDHKKTNVTMVRGTPPLQSFKALPLKMET